MLIRDGKRRGFTIIIILGILMTYINQMAVSPILSEIRDAYAVSGESQLNLLSTIMYPSIILFSVLGSVQKRIGTKRLYSLCLFLTAVGMGMCFFARSYATLLPARLIFGAGFGLGMLKTSGVFGVALSFQNAEEWRFSVDEYREKMSPWDERLLAAARESFEYVNCHLCSWGNEPNHIESWKDYDHMCCNWGVHIERDLSLAKGREFFTSAPSVMGGFDVRPGKLIITGSESEIKTFTKQLIRDTGRIGMLISSDCSLQEETPEQNIRYVVEATEEFEQE